MTFAPLGLTPLIDGRTPTWVARVGGYEVAVEHVRDSVALAVPGNAGRLIAHLDDRRRTTAGWWVQPQPVDGRYPFASHVVLRATQAGVWQGDVALLSDREGRRVCINSNPHRRASRASHATVNKFTSKPDDRLAMSAWRDPPIPTRGTWTTNRPASPTRAHRF
jgi:hypothetical protein